MILFPSATTIAFIEIDTPHGPVGINVSDIVVVQPTGQISECQVMTRNGMTCKMPHASREILGLMREAAQDRSY